MASWWRSAAAGNNQIRDLLGQQAAEGDAVRLGDFAAGAGPVEINGVIGDGDDVVVRLMVETSVDVLFAQYIAAYEAVGLADAESGAQPDEFPVIEGEAGLQQVPVSPGARVKMGFGLASDYRIVQNHQGEIHIESEVGKGTTVTVKLPSGPDAGQSPAA